MRNTLLLFLIALLVAGCASPGSSREAALELESLGVAWKPGRPAHEGYELSSRYLTMRDGVRIAVDVYLPQGLARGQRVPAIIRGTRYWRRWELWPPFSWFFGERDFTGLFTSHGYAVVVVDARGSGASFGIRKHPWSADEVEDYREVIGWIAAQPWSDGNVGAQGISYDGTAAEFMAGLGHPALKAACVRFALYDVYADIAFPGGVMNQRFLRNWSAFNRTLDAGNVPEFFPFLAELAIRGPAPVDGPGGRALMAEAQAEHSANTDIYEAARQVEFRDDVAEETGVSVDGFSPHARGGPRVPLLVIGGWKDGAYADAMLKRFARFGSGQRAILGAFNHAGTEDTDPFRPQDAEPEPSFDAQLLEILRFFDHHLKGLGPRPREELVFKVMNTGKWLSSTAWPPKDGGSATFWLTGGGGLASREPEPARAAFKPNLEFRTGGKRWFTQLSRSDVHIRPEIWEQQGVLAFTSDPLESDTVIAGSPVLDLSMSSSFPGAAVHAYLLAVSPDGGHVCLTQGQLRPIHRKLRAGIMPQSPGAPARTFNREDAEPLLPGFAGRVTFGLWSTAVRVPRGFRLKLMLAGADASQFARYPLRGNPEFTVFTGPEASFLRIPLLGKKGSWPPDFPR